MYVAFLAEFDMNLLEKKLKEQKEKREKARKPRKKQEYTPVAMDSGMNIEEGFENDPLPPSNGASKEKTIKMKSTKDKPLPATPSNKKPPTPTHTSADPTSPKSSTAAKKVLPAAPSKKPNKKQGPTTPHKPGSSSSSNFARLQEIAKQNYPMGGQASSKKSQQPAETQQSEEDLGGVMEPMYANTAGAGGSEHSQSLSESGDGYQNWDFSGPPKPPQAGGSAPTKKTSLTPNAAAASAYKDDDNQYQNVNFQTAKTAKNPPKSSPRPSAKPSPRPNAKSSSQQRQHQAAAKQTNASAYADDASVYQNVGFKTTR